MFDPREFPDPLAVTEDDLVERRVRPGWLEYDAEYRWLVHTDPGGASEIVADHVSPWRARVALARWSAVRLLSRLVAKVKGWLGR